MSAILYTQPGSAFIVEPANGKTWTLAEMQEYVGGSVEMVRLRDGKVMLVNEAGRMAGLKPNLCAALAGQTIVGNVLVCDEAMMGD